MSTEKEVLLPSAYYSYKTSVPVCEPLISLGVDAIVLQLSLQTLNNDVIAKCPLY